MFVIKKFKCVVALFAAMSIFASVASAQFYEVPEELQTYGNEIYTKARSYFGGRSFSGYCGTYVTYQLRAMGICNRNDNMCGNGNKWYSNFENVDMTSGGYYVYRESGGECLKKLAEKYGDDLRNIVVSFPVQSGYSAAYPGAGHAFVIHKLHNGIAYYSESFGFGQYREGQVVAEDAESLMRRYSSRHGEALGAVLLSNVSLQGNPIQGFSPKWSEEVFLQLKNSLKEISNVTFIIDELKESSQTREV